MFDHELAFDPANDLEAFLRAAPAKWVVYLMTDAEDSPVQLLCVKNLRYSLKRRLSVEDPAGAAPNKRVNYREIVRKIRWRRVDGAFEADLTYLEAARKYFPKSYQSIAGLRPAWFVHVNPEAPFPRYTKTTDLGIRAGNLFGPIEDKNSAGQFIEDIEDWFDLCRYYHILTEAPHGKACAYKEMGKCPAPCDGTISMEQYRRLIDWSSRAIVDPKELIREQTARMRQAAEEMRYETAAKIKSYIESISKIGTGPLRHLRRLEDFQYLSIQPCPHEGAARVFLITPGRVEEIAGIPLEPIRPADLMRLALERAAIHCADAIDLASVERVGVVTHHLFQSKSHAGKFIPLDSIDEIAISRAYRDLLKHKTPDSPDEEGVLKELDVNRR